MPQFDKIKPEDRPFGTARNDNKGTEYVRSIHTDQTGGMCMVDVLIMHSGRVLTITDECVVAWPSIKSWEDSFETGEEDYTGGYIDLTLWPAIKDRE